MVMSSFVLFSLCNKWTVLQIWGYAEKLQPAFLFKPISQIHQYHFVPILRAIFLIYFLQNRLFLELDENAMFINTLFCETNESRCDIYMHGISNSSVAQSRALLSLKFSSSTSSSVTSWIATVAVLHNQQILFTLKRCTAKRYVYKFKRD